MKFSLDKLEEEKLLSLFNQHDKNIDYFIYLGKIVGNDIPLLSDKEINDNKDKNDFEMKNLAFDRLEKLFPITNKFIKDNIRWDTKLIAAKDFKENPYYKVINNLSFKENGWTLSNVKRSAYSLAPYQEEYAYGSNYSIKMGLMMFKSNYIYPSISLYDTEWMSLNQHEIRTMEVPIQLARGKVLTLGLGLGYFAYMAAIKEEVKEVHIVEMDLELINLFNKYLLPLFPYPEKIHIHKADAFHFIKTIKDKDYDYIFSDLWHDVSDGYESYIILKRAFKDFTYTRCTYWIEDSIIAYLRLLIIGIIKDEYYKNSGLYDKTQLLIKEKLNNYEINNSSDIDYLLCLKGIEKTIL